MQLISPKDVWFTKLLPKMKVAQIKLEDFSSSMILFCFRGHFLDFCSCLPAVQRQPFCPIKRDSFIRSHQSYSTNNSLLTAMLKAILNPTDSFEDTCMGLCVSVFVHKSVLTCLNLLLLWNVIFGGSHLSCTVHIINTHTCCRALTLGRREEGSDRRMSATHCEWFLT